MKLNETNVIVITEKVKIKLANVNKITDTKHFKGIFVIREGEKQV